MTRQNAVQYLAFVVLVTLATKPLGGYLHRVFTKQRTLFDAVSLPVERLIYRLCGIDPADEMTASRYIGCFLMLGGLGALFVYAILRLQRFLPWFFPAYHTTAMTPDLAGNTAISFTTTTTWQAYAGENTMSYFSQMAALTTGNFLCRCGRPGNRHRVHSRVRTGSIAGARQLLERCHACRCSGCCSPRRSSARSCWSGWACR